MTVGHKVSLKARSVVMQTRAVDDPTQRIGEANRRLAVAEGIRSTGEHRISDERNNTCPSYRRLDSPFAGERSKL